MITIFITTPLVVLSKTLEHPKDCDVIYGPLLMTPQYVIKLLKGAGFSPKFGYYEPNVIFTLT